MTGEVPSLKPLFEYAAELFRSEVRRRGSADLTAELASPDWSADRFDWPGYVPEEVRAAWPGLSADARLVAYIFAREMAVRDEPTD